MGNFAHADLQHGNVLLVTGDAQNKLGLKLIDYDGMWVPALADYHSGEIGHPNFQHPLRLKDKLYNGDVDRFPHLVIASALRATVLGSRDLWDKFDNGDNLLFKEADLRDPGNSKVFKALWEMHDDVLCVLVGKLALASKDPMRKTPWLDDLLLTEEGERLTDAEEKKVLEMLGVGPHFTASKSTAPAAPAANQFADFEVIEDEEDKKAAARREHKGKKKTKPARAKSGRDDDERDGKAKSFLPYYIGGGVAAVAVIVAVIVMSGGGNNGKPPPNVAQNDGKSQQPNTAAPPGKKEPPPGTKIDSPKKEPSRDAPVDVKKDPPVEAKDPNVGMPVAKMGPPAEAPAGEFKQLWRRGAPWLDLAFSPNGSEMVIVEGPSARTLSVRDGVQIGLEKPSEWPMQHFHTGADGSYLFRTGPTPQTGELWSWDPKSKQRRFVIDQEITPFTRWTIARAANLALVTQKTGGYFVYSLADGKKLETVALPNKYTLLGLSCTADGEAVLAYEGPDTIYFRAKKNAPFRELAKLDNPAKHAVMIVLSPDAKYYAQYWGGTNSSKIRIYDTDTGKPHALLDKHTGLVYGVAFTPDGRRLLSTGDTTLRLWDVASGQEVKQVELAGAAIAPVHLSPDGLHVATFSDRPRSLQMWRMPDEGEPLVKKGPPVEPAPAGKPPAIKEVWTVRAPIGALRFTPDDAKISILAQGSINLYDPKNGELLGTSKVTDSTVGVYTPCPDGLFIVAASNSDQKRLELVMWDPAASKSRFTFDEAVFAQAGVLLPKVNSVLLSAKGGGLGVFSLKDGTRTERIVLPKNMTPTLVVGAPGGESVVAWMPLVTCYRASSQQPWRLMEPITTTGITPTIQLSPDGKRYLHFVRDGSIFVHDTETGKVIATLDGHARDIKGAVFMQDGRYVLSVSWDHTMRLWDALTGKEANQVRFPGPISSLAVSSDGRFAAASSNDPMGNSLHLWSIAANGPGDGGDPPIKKGPDVPATPEDAALDLVAQSQRVESLKAADSATMPNQIDISFSIVNRSGIEVPVPLTERGNSGPKHFGYMLRYWVERLGDDPKIPALSTAPRQGKLHGLGALVVIAPATIKKDGVFFQNIGRPVKGYPPGKYRLTVEVHNIKNDKLHQSASTDFEVRAE